MVIYDCRTNYMIHRILSPVNLITFILNRIISNALIKYNCYHFQLLNVLIALNAKLNQN